MNGCECCGQPDGYCRNCGAAHSPAVEDGRCELCKESCNHRAAHQANVAINSIENVGRFQADITIECAQCGKPFRFLGLPAGLNLNGAAVSVDGTELRVGIAPVGEEVPPVVASGFSVVKEQ